MENEGHIIVPIIGYIIGLFSPIICLVYGGILFFVKKDVPLYRKHGRYMIFFAIFVFIVGLILRFTILN